jgi:hypothetical protein
VARFELVSLIGLISRPEAYAGRVVTAIGYVSLADMDSALYLTELDCQNKITKNAIWLEPPFPPEAPKVHLSYGIVVGTVVPSLGRLGLYSGCITTLTRVGAWR